MGEEELKKKKVLGSLATAENVQAIMVGRIVLRVYVVELQASQNEGSMEQGERMAVDHAESRVESDMLAEFERRKRARTLTLPTDDVVVGNLTA